MFLCPRPLAVAILAALPFCACAAVNGDDDPATGDGITTLPEVVVEGDRASIAPARRLDADAIRTAASSDTASLLDRLPGVGTNAAGGVSGLPSIRGLADDRLRIQIDGADISASCPNHMNPALSYVPPSQVGSITVYPGIVPVSRGGDSIGGSIVVETAPPAFASPGEGVRFSGEAGAYYRSNGDVQGVNFGATLATEHVRAHYSASTARADNLRAGDDFKSYEFTGRAGHTLDRDEIGSTGYVTHHQRLDLAYSRGNHLLEARFGWQSMPRQGFPNQRMDLTDNRQRRMHLRWLGDFDWGRMELRGYRERLEHAMDFGQDKRYWYGMASGGSFPAGGGAVPCAPIGPSCAAGMPMLTESDTSALSAEADIALTGDGHLRIGAELRRHRLDDWWPPSGGMMWPGAFWNIRDGRRDRDAAYLEWEQRLGEISTLELGVRHERVRMDAGMVRGYDPSSNMMGSFQMRDATRFNASDRARSDANWDATAILRVAAGERADLVFGLARKTRSPGLYEVYPWSTWTMAAVMNNTAGDGNGYVGNLDLRPERAATASITVDLHAPDRRWELQLTPYYTRIADYIDAVQWDPATDAARAVPVRNAFTVLRYENQSARLHGIDVSAKATLAETAIGTFGIDGELAWASASNTRTGDRLYRQMPPHLRLAIQWRHGGWEAVAEGLGVQRKDAVSRVRNELETPGYGLLNLRLSRTWSKVRAEVGIDNALDRFHALPTGGAYLGQGTTMSINPTPPNEPRWGTAVPGPGRSVYASVNLRF